MRTMILGVLVVFAVLTAVPAKADDWGRRHWQCNHGNEFACHRIWLRHRCDNGNGRACRALYRGD